MGANFFALLCIVGVAFIAPLISFLVPKSIVPEVVLLLIGGLIIGPSVLGIAHSTTSVTFLRELGLAFLFLVTGYEIDVNELRGSSGRHAVIAWIGSLIFAFVTVGFLGVQGGILSANSIAIAIAMTSTAIGTILPILRDRGLLPTAVGAAILNHGAIGEVGPVILMAVLLGSRSTWKSLAILALFLAVTLLIVRFTANVKRAGKRLIGIINLGASTTAQTTIRLTVLLLVGLCTLATVFELDVLMGAFAAGLILRYAIPNGSRELEEKLDGLAYGFFVPIFFVTSGMNLNLEFSFSTLRTVVAFLILLVLVRGVPVCLASFLERRADGQRAYSLRQCLQISVYSTTALPIIVAVTQLAVSAGAMSQSFATALVLAGAASVLIMPAAGLVLDAGENTVVRVSGQVMRHGSSGGIKPRSGSGSKTLKTAPVAAIPNADDVAKALDTGANSAPVPPANALASAKSEPGRLGGRNLSEVEASHLAERLARIETDRLQWRAQMRRLRSLEREEAKQRRAVLRAQDRQQRRSERTQIKQLRQEASKLRKKQQ